MRLPLCIIGAIMRLPLWLHPARGAPLAALARILLPASCALCGAACDATVCAACHSQFFGQDRPGQDRPGQDRPRCRQCANPLALIETGAHCGACLAAPPPFDATLVACDYAAPVDQLVLQLKFGARLGLAPLFAALLRDAVLRRPDFVLPALLCPVPLGPARLAERGFNQALEIARPLARALGVLLQPRLAVRVHETQAQSRVTPAERARNIEHAFIVAQEAAPLVRGRHIGIVDDVMTSGQTLGELAATFKRFGAARVTCLAFARTPPRDFTF